MVWHNESGDEDADAVPCRGEDKEEEENEVEEVPITLHNGALVSNDGTGVIKEGEEKE